MNIVQETPNLIALKDSDYKGLVIGIIFIVVPILLIPLIFSSQSANVLIFALVLFVFLVTGIFSVINSYFSTITLDKSINKLSFVRKGVLGKRNNDYSLSNISSIQLRQEYASRSTSSVGFSTKLGTMSRRLDFQLFFIFKSGEEIPLDHLQQPGGLSISGLPLLGGSGYERELGQKLATFLNVPFNDSGLPSMGQTISDLVGAIKNVNQKKI